MLQIKLISRLFLQKKQILKSENLTKEADSKAVSVKEAEIQG